MAEELRKNVLETATLARINARCAHAYQHDIRGTLQAVYSTVELLKRSLAATSPDPARIERVTELASNALQRHEESTLAMLDILTLRRMNPAVIDLGGLVVDVVRFLRNEASAREISITVHEPPGVAVTAAANVLRSLLVGLLLVAIDSAPAAGEIVVTVSQQGGTATVEMLGASDLNLTGRNDPAGTLDMTLRYADRYLKDHGGSLEIITAPIGTRLRMSYPT